MNFSQLAQAVVSILSMHLPDLLQGSKALNVKATENEVINLLWTTLYPKISIRAEVMNAARAVADNPSDQSEALLAKKLEEVFRVNRYVAEEIASLIENSMFAHMILPTSDKTPSPHQSQVQSETQAEDAKSTTPSPQLTSPANLVCAACGRQDDTVRFVTYPYVASLVLVTFRRAFSGLWCSRHATLYHTLAVLITGTLGWFGIPFGIIYTPITLITLAKGGKQNSDLNHRMLREIAQYKLNQRDTQGAIQCFEAALKWQDDKEVKSQLGQLYRNQPEPQTVSPVGQVLFFTATMLGASLLGITIGMLETLISFLFGSFEEIPFLLAVLSWAQLIVLAILGGLVLPKLITGALARTQTSNRLLGSSLAVVSALLAAYGLPTGRVLVFTFEPSNPLSFESIGEAISFVGLLLTRGGGVFIQDMLALGGFVNNFYVLIILVTAGFYLLKSVAEAHATVDWQKRLDAIRVGAIDRIATTARVGFISIAGVILSFVLLTIVFFPRGVDYGEPEAQPYVDTGFAYLEQGETEMAIVEFEEAISIDPDSDMAYFGLGHAYLAQNKCEESFTGFETGLDLAPIEFSYVFHFGLGRAYSCWGEVDQAIDEYQLTIELYPDLVEAHLNLGWAYFNRGEFARAVEEFEVTVSISPELSLAHSSLALAYYQLDQQASKDEALHQALNLATEDVYDYYYIGAYYYTLKDFSTAETFLIKSVEISPEDPTVLTYLADTYVAQKKFDLALEIIDTVLSIDEDYPYAYLTLSDVYIEKYDLSEALSILQQALDIPLQDKTDLSKIHSGLSFVYFHDGLNSQALEEAQQAVTLPTLLCFRTHNAGFCIL